MRLDGNREQGTLDLDATHVVVDGKVIDSDGKSAGHSSVAFTTTAYMHGDLDADRALAERWLG